MAIAILLSIVGHYCLSAVSSSLQPAQIFSPDGLVHEIKGTVSLYKGHAILLLKPFEINHETW